MNIFSQCKIRSDSRTSIITASEDITTSANKHYETYLLGVREIIKRGYINLEYDNTLNNYFDMLTKPQTIFINDIEDV